MKHYIAISFLLFAASCDTSEPPPGGELSVQIAAVDASCTEVWLEVKIPAGVSTRAVQIQRDSTVIFNSTVATAETMIVDERLLPNRQYAYTLTRPNGLLTDRTTTVITTLDTTSHDFMWQIDTLGDGTSSVLNDVAIINDTLAYAVGEIYLSGDPLAYNLAKWNGNAWELMRIPFTGPCSAVDYPPLKAIWAISTNQILVTNGGAVATYNRVTTTLDCSMNHLLAGAINKLYATNAQDIYAVGNNGTIVHYNGSTWQRVESGITGILVDLWGHTDPSEGRTAILSVGGASGDVRVLTLSPVGVRDTLFWPPSELLVSIWTISKSRVYGAGVGLWRFNGSSWRLMDGIQPGLIFRRVRGSAENNIATAGWSGLAHFNGVNWKLYSEITSDFRFESVAVSQGMVIAVGFAVSGLFSDRAVIAVGRYTETRKMAVMK